nr:RhuM family protein [Methylomicrobium agile]
MAEEWTPREIPMTMVAWAIRLDAFLEFTERGILQNSGKVSMEIAKKHAESEFEKIPHCAVQVI